MQKSLSTKNWTICDFSWPYMCLFPALREKSWLSKTFWFDSTFTWRSPSEDIAQLVGRFEWDTQGSVERVASCRIRSQADCNYLVWMGINNRTALTHPRQPKSAFSSDAPSSSCKSLSCLPATRHRDSYFGAGGRRKTPNLPESKLRLPLTCSPQLAAPTQFKTSVVCRHGRGAHDSLFHGSFRTYRESFIELQILNCSKWQQIHWFW